MFWSQWLGSVVLFGVVALGTLGGCGGSRNSREGQPPDYALGEGDVMAGWTSGSTDLVHDSTRHALYYPDMANLDVAAIDLASGNESTLVALQFEPSMLRLTSDGQELYVLESAASAAGNNGFPDIVRYNIAGNFINSTFIELDSDLRIDDFVATVDDRVAVAVYHDLSPPAVSLQLFNANSGALLDEAVYNMFLGQQLALKQDQLTLLSALLRSTNSVLNTVSIANDTIAETLSVNLTLAQTVENTFEPAGDRIFRADGTVWDGDEERNLGAAYNAIDFDLDDDRIVTLVERSGGFIVRFNDLDSLEMLSEQSIPSIDDAAGMAPVKLYVDDDKLYVVYREVTSAVEKDYLLVEFDYP